MTTRPHDRLMKRITTKWKLLLVALLLPSCMIAQQSMTMKKKIAPQEMKVARELAPYKLKDLKPTITSLAKKAPVLKTEALGTVTMDNLLGSWIVQDPTLLPGQLPSAGNSATITKIDEQTIEIKNFWTAVGVSVKLKANVDFQNNTISIPNQKAFGVQDNGDCYICWVNIQDGKIMYDTSKPITGTISANGIEITNAWGLFITEGTGKGGAFGIYTGSTFTKGNGIMSCDEQGGSHIEYPVFISQKSEDIIEVLNFADYGKKIEITINEEKDISIPTQLAYSAPDGDGFYTYTVDWNAGLIGPIIEGTGTEHELNWGAWTIQSEKYYIGKHLTGKITTDVTINYPKLSIDSFEGEGTETNPYLIKGKDELALLARKVNKDTELIYGKDNKHTKSFLGKYFKVTQNIDLTETRMDPIGNKWPQCFAGTFDGNGKTITGLTISSSYGCAGLFGRTDTVAVIKNVNLKEVNIDSYGTWVGGIAGWCQGSISNCHVKGMVKNNDKETGGIAGQAKNIANCTFSGTVLGLNGCVGGIAGKATGTISNCFSDALVLATSSSAAVESCGGIVGALYLEAASTINCYFAGTVAVSGPNPIYVGGIVGDCYKGNIYQCYNVGTVSGVSGVGAAGGIAGNLIGNLTDCYNSGRVSQSPCKTVGGIAGGVSDNRNIMTGELIAHSQIKNCYTVGTVIAEIAGYDPEKETREIIGGINQTAAPIIENIYFDRQMINFSSKKYGVLTKELTSAEGPTGFSADIWNFSEGFYPRLKSMPKDSIEDLSVSAIHFDTELPDNVSKITKDFIIKLAGNKCMAGFYLNEGNGQGTLHAKGHAAYMQDDGTVQLTGNGKDTLYIASGPYTRTYIINTTSSSEFEGEGTQSNPFLIKTKADLIKLSALTGENFKQPYRDTYFKMTNDIDLEYDETFAGINFSSDANHQFLGHFDGGGYSIHRMKLAKVEWKIKPEDAEDGWGTPVSSGNPLYMAFISRLGIGGSISNLTMASDCKIENWGYSAAFVGMNYGGLIENCKNYANVITYSGNAAGICASNDRLGAGTIRNCYNAGAITAGYMTAGGITSSNAGNIENCQNDGTVTVKKLSTFMGLPTNPHNTAGGIAGTMNAYEKIYVKNNINTGMITADGNVGGIFGTVSISGTDKVDVEITNNLNYGSVFAKDVLTRGAFCGNFSISTKRTISNNYYDAQLLPFGAANNGSQDGISGVETSVLTQGNLPNFSTDIWTLEAGHYPSLKAFASEEKANQASQVIVKIATGETAADLKSNLILSAPEGVNWTLKKGSVFTIDGSTVKVAASTDKVANDTLTAVSTVLTKVIIITKLPEIPLEGNGTADSPYLIKNAPDWNALSVYISTCSKTMEDKYIQIAADIEFKDQIFMPIAGDGITSFEGTLDGNKKVINNITFNDTQSGYLGLFGRIGEKGSVKDLTIGSGSLTSTKTRMGGFAGKLGGTLTGCINKANVSTSASYAGGIVATVEATGQLTNCINYGEINGKSGYVGGIAAESAAGSIFTVCGNEGKLIGTSLVAGIVANSNAATYNQCYNKGTIEANGTNIGGIIGSVLGSDTLRITGCYNTGNVKATNTAGGIVASAKSTPCLIKNCYNTGDVTTTTTASSVGTGGIIGTIAAATTIYDSHNTGNVTSEKCANVGGIIGFAGSTANENARIRLQRCYNEGNISGLINNVGGISGNMANYMTIDSCYNQGAVEGTNYVGGISAALGGAFNIMSNCWNTGSVTAQKWAVGGLFGTGNFAANITDCFNAGTVASTGVDNKTAYQVGGLAGMSKAIFTNCYNSGIVDGKKQIGGLVGQAFSGSINTTTSQITYGTCFNNCYNIGTITKLDTLSGNFVGDLSGKTWEYNKIEKVYALNTQPMLSDSIAVLISNTDMAKLELGEGWINGDDYTFPWLKNCDNDYARLYATTIVLSGEDTPERVTTNFFVGTPENIVWTSDSDIVSFSGNNATLKANSKGEVTLTATIGEISKDITITVANPTSIENTTASKIIVKQEFYTISGIKLDESQIERGNIYIITKTYNDGTTENVKERY